MPSCDRLHHRVAFFGLLVTTHQKGSRRGRRPFLGRAFSTRAHHTIDSDNQEEKALWKALWIPREPPNCRPRPGAVASLAPFEDDFIKR